MQLIAADIVYVMVIRSYNNKKRDSYDTRLIMQKLKSEEFNSRCYKYEKIRENYICTLL